MNSHTLRIVLAVAALAAAGCTNRQVDWPAASAVLHEADATAADFAAMLGPGDPLTARIDTWRAAAAPVLGAVDARAADPEAADPAEAIDALLLAAVEAAMALDDRARRRAALRIVASVRVGLRLTGLALSHAQRGGS